MNGSFIRDNTTWLGSSDGRKMTDKKIWASLYKFKNEAKEEAKVEMREELRLQVSQFISIRRDINILFEEINNIKNVQQHVINNLQAKIEEANSL